MTFEGAKTQIPVSSFQSYMHDPDYKSSVDFIKYEIDPPGREISLFTKGKLKIAYAVRYDNNKDITYYYTKYRGVLLFMDIWENTDNKKLKYPVKLYRYDTEGKLIAAGICVSKDEAFLYDKKQKLIVHSLGDFGYNKNGKKVWKSQLVDF